MSDLEGTGTYVTRRLVYDEESVVLTRTYLTASVLDRKIELGLLVRERTLALTVANHFQALIDRRVLQRLDSASDS